MRLGDEMIAATRYLRNHDLYGSGWYWVCLGKNTCATPVETEEQAKAEALAYYKGQKEEDD